MADLGPSDWLGNVVPDRETDGEENAMADLTPPKQLVQDEGGHWYLVLHWSDRYSHIVDPEALKRLQDRAEDDPNYAETRVDWQSAWFAGMIREQDRQLISTVHGRRVRARMALWPDDASSHGGAHPPFLGNGAADAGWCAKHRGPHPKNQSPRPDYQVQQRS